MPVDQRFTVSIETSVSTFCLEVRVGDLKSSWTLVELVLDETFKRRGFPLSHQHDRNLTLTVTVTVRSKDRTAIPSIPSEVFHFVITISI